MGSGPGRMVKQLSTIVKHHESVRHLDHNSRSVVK